MKLKEKIDKIILASQSVVRQKILLDHNINCDVVPSKLDEEPIKEKLIINNIDPDEISQNLASLKAKKVSNKFSKKSIWFAKKLDSKRMSLKYLQLLNF